MSTFATLMPYYHYSSQFTAAGISARPSTRQGHVVDGSEFELESLPSVRCGCVEGIKYGKHMGHIVKTCFSALPVQCRSKDPCHCTQNLLYKLNCSNAHIILHNLHTTYVD